MGLLDNLMGNAEIDTDPSMVEEFLFQDEEVIQTYKFYRDSIVLTTHGIYVIDVQGLSGKKIETKFIPKTSIKWISFETAGTFDIDVDIKIGVENNIGFTAEGMPYNAPVSFKVKADQKDEAKEVIKLVKKYYLF
ncbi:PH domain-containing protein [Methanobrevibacter sp.]|uniref:PH domain-containing protein n=1 Tax=Methanobrevibacter sp. TaxID=66852 RepID=UPI003D7CFB4A